MLCGFLNIPTYYTYGLYPCKECPPFVFNIWDGFAAEKYNTTKEGDISNILYHFKVVRILMKE